MGGKNGRPVDHGKWVEPAIMLRHCRGGRYIVTLCMTRDWEKDDRNGKENPSFFA
jgi:hypothetical protein